MPLPRKKDAGGTGAPIMNIPMAHVRLTNVEEHTKPYTITRKSDGAKFTLDPAFNCIVEVIDDGQDGSNNGARFFESFRYKQDKDGGWFNQKNSKLGAVTELKKPGYFDDDTIPALEASDLEDFEMLCGIKPKRNPSTGAVTGSTIGWESMQPLPKEKAAAVDAEEDDEYSDLPF